MSLMHNFIQSIVRRGHKPYSIDNPPDYQSRRIAEEKRFKNLPNDLDITEIDEQNIKGEYISKAGNDTSHLILYIHGGGFVGGSAKSRRDITFYLVRRSGYNVIAINYSLAPENKFPTPVVECFRAYLEIIRKFGASNVCVMGESAGGNLVLSTLHMAKDNGVEMPSSICVFSPATVLGKQLPSYIQNGKKDAMLDENSHIEILNTYLNSQEDSDDKYASPLYGSFEGFPPTILFASDSEVLMDDSIMLNEKMKEQGVQIKFILAHKLMHAYVTMPYFREAKKSLKQTIEFMSKHFK